MPNQDLSDRDPDWERVEEALRNYYAAGLQTYKVFPHSDRPYEHVPGPALESLARLRAISVREHEALERIADIGLNAGNPTTQAPTIARAALAEPTDDQPEP